MITIASFRKSALSFPEVVELPHFDRTSFRVNKKIFATISEKDSIAMLRLSLVDQSVFCDLGEGAVYPVAGGWGKTGATYFNLKKLKKGLFEDALRTAYCGIAPRKLAELMTGKNKQGV